MKRVRNEPSFHHLFWSADYVIEYVDFSVRTFGFSVDFSMAELLHFVKIELENTKVAVIYPRIEVIQIKSITLGLIIHIQKLPLDGEIYFFLQIAGIYIATRGIARFDQFHDFLAGYFTGSLVIIFVFLTTCHEDNSKQKGKNVFFHHTKFNLVFRKDRLICCIVQ